MRDVIVLGSLDKHNHEKHGRGGGLAWATSVHCVPCSLFFFSPKGSIRIYQARANKRQHWSLCVHVFPAGYHQQSYERHMLLFSHMRLLTFVQKEKKHTDVGTSE